jgi:hypothetical protein
MIHRHWHQDDFRHSRAGGNPVAAYRAASKHNSRHPVHNRRPGSRLSPGRRGFELPARFACWKPAYPINLEVTRKKPPSFRRKPESSRGVSGRLQHDLRRPGSQSPPWVPAFAGTTREDTISRPFGAPSPASGRGENRASLLSEERYSPLSHLWERGRGRGPGNHMYIFKEKMLLLLMSYETKLEGKTQVCPLIRLVSCRFPVTVRSRSRQACSLGRDRCIFEPGR